MDYLANVANSEIDVSGIRTVLVQGDASYPVIRFILDPALTGLSWRVRGTYIGSNIAVLSQEITPTESATAVTLDWSVSSDFTTYDCDMQLVLVGTNDTGTTVVKAVADITVQKDWSIGTTGTITLNLFEQLMAQLSSTALKLDQTIPQTITGGIPKLASTRVIDENNELVDKKFVEDSIAPVTTNKNWLYNGRDLSTIFTAAQLIAAVRADNWSNIRVGDYWPITLSGTFRDYGSYTCPTGTNYYSDTGLTTLAGSTSTSYQATYVNATYCSISISSTTYYVSTTACLAYYERTLSSAAIKLEITAISPYINIGSTAFTSPHLLFISRDTMPFTCRARLTNSTWTDAAATNPWLGSALYKTLNDATYGVLPIVAAANIGAYIHAGTTGDAGLRFIGENKAAGATTSSFPTAISRGKLFVPTEAEIFSSARISEAYGTVGQSQLPLFFGSLRHVVKGLGNAGTRSSWWTMNTPAGSSTEFIRVTTNGENVPVGASSAYGVPLCFIIA